MCGIIVVVVVVFVVVVVVFVVFVVVERHPRTTLTQRFGDSEEKLRVMCESLKQRYGVAPALLPEDDDAAAAGR